ncbi:MAG: DNA repair protein RadA, partial [Candidatus Margulisbacteria bacterium]|nr:DNA repair protein RadA [Candidatus Margulisiibacteriota bacterium]
MPKADTHFFCQSCGNEFPRWTGQCPACNEWNSLVEEIQSSKVKSQNIGQIQNYKTEKPTPITEIDFKNEERTATGMGELDRVLGGDRKST